MPHTNKEEGEKKIPCNCPKGGMYSDGRICEKCQGTEWISSPTEEKKGKATGERKTIFSGRMSGKNTLLDRDLLEEIHKGEKYVVFEMIGNRVHIIPDAKLKSLLSTTEQAVREDLKVKIEEYKKSTYFQALKQFNDGRADEVEEFIEYLSALSPQEHTKE